MPHPRLLSSTVLCCAFTLLAFCPVRATTLTVHADGSGDYPTIADAVAAAIDGDVIELGAGVYAGDGNRDVATYGLSVTIRSAGGDPASVVLDCAGTAAAPHRGFVMIFPADMVLEGITIRNGYGSPGGIPSAGALLIADHASPIIRHCVFENNHAGMSWDHAAGAVYVDGFSSARFEDCEFRGNSAYFGGAVGVNHFSQAEFVDCRFLDNVGVRGGAIWGNSTSKTRCLFARNSAEQGGAIWGNGFNAELSIGCTYTENSAPEGGAIYALDNYNDPVRLVDTIVANSPLGEAIWFEPGVIVELSCSDLFGNAGGDWIGALAPQVDLNGNFSADPCFCAPEADDFHLCADSWCLPGRHPWGCDQLVGAFGAGCGGCSCGGPVATELMSWGSVKGLYR